MFSIAGAVNTIYPIVAHGISQFGFVELICNAPSVVHLRQDPSQIWGLFFAASKVPELGDTIFIVLRKKELVVLQWYHHLCTLVLTALGMVYVSPFNNTGAIFAAMNYFVHSFMYTWYAFTRTGWKSPKSLKIMITAIQFIQMVAALFVIWVASSDYFSPYCGRWPREGIWSFYGFMIMYASYAALFAQLFAKSYLLPKRKST